MIKNYKELFYIDIETAPIKQSIEELDPAMLSAWKYKCERNNQEVEDEYNKSASFFPELSRVVSIGMGKFDKDGIFTVKAVGGPNEVSLLTQFADTLQRNKILCTHAGSYFDIPFLGKRYVLNGMAIPAPLQTYGMKPWEIPHVDTKALWSYGQFGNSQAASLEMLCAAFGIPSPKGEMSGKDVKSYFFAGRYKEINDYCLADVIALARVAQCLAGEDWVEDKNIKFA
jgi:predicted PolB exonuclease-like 3'-5' exonuclease